jgi:hypothetical protein
MTLPLSRRSLLIVTAASAAAGLVSLPPVAEMAVAADTRRRHRGARRRRAYQMRKQCARLAFNRPLPRHLANGEEDDHPFVANFSKGLPHDPLGEVDPAAYRLLLGALERGAAEDLERIPLAGDRRLRNPQAGLAFDLEGPDSHHLAMRPAPRIDGPENSSEMAELYWHALARDFAGIHWRTDSTESLKLGEAVAIGILEEQRPTYAERARFTFTRFDGTRVTV